jgi:uncharacterized protein (DUF2141 family)
MKQLIICTLLLCVSHSYSLFAQSPETGTLEIRFTHIRSEKGSIAIGINTASKGWPRKAQFEFQYKKENMKDGVFVVQVPDLPFGTLAVSVLDDENSNLKMDMSIRGPKEGYGFSNDAPLKLGPPKFDACSFQFTRSGQQISIRLKYMGKDK